MNLLLVAATAIEIKPFTERLVRAGRPGEQLTQYQFNAITIDVLITGAGMVPTAYFLGKQLTCRHYDLTINAGLAGTFHESLPLGTVVNVVEDQMSDLGAEDGDKFHSVFALGLTDPDSIPFREGKLINDFRESGIFAEIETLRNLPHVSSITSNTVHGNAASIARIQSISPADIESMEGAAFFYVCFCEKNPCLQIRAVSNLVEERDKTRWNTDLAITNLCDVLWAITMSHA
ncbi:MAG: futalosine hydrolase [Bacteroidales bacterium]|nr:futalosine hydrolase [Bacteroidales bacterium]